VEILDAANRAAPQSRWRAKIDGHLISTRRIGDALYVVTRSVPTVDGFTQGILAPSQRTFERANALPLGDLLPRISVNGGIPTPLVDASQVFAPPQGDRLPSADMTIVTVIDLGQARVRQALAIARQRRRAARHRRQPLHRRHAPGGARPHRSHPAVPADLRRSPTSTSCASRPRASSPWAPARWRLARQRSRQVGLRLGEAGRQHRVVSERHDVAVGIGCQQTA
jgi:hypothetical protein